MHAPFTISALSHGSSCGLRLRVCIASFAWVLCLAPIAAETSSVNGVVQDSSGAVISAATVRLEDGAFRASTKTDDKGFFSFADVPPSFATLEVTAEGFQTLRKVIFVGAMAESSVLTLKPAVSIDQVIVSATRTGIRLSDSPGSTILLSSVDLAATPALRVDDAVRQVPGFSLFRRSSSRTANASAQGVSLRGLGGSASSRALVLADGISLVDPFGGWVYWTRVPRVALSIFMAAQR